MQYVRLSEAMPEARMLPFLQAKGTACATKNSRSEHSLQLYYRTQMR